MELGIWFSIPFDIMLPLEYSKFFSYMSVLFICFYFYLFFYFGVESGFQSASSEGGQANGSQNPLTGL